MIHVLFTGPDRACIYADTLVFSTYLNVSFLYNATLCESKKSFKST